ncbi:glycerol-3-phosphate acyltransferase [Gammaproteobacteria bacterium]|nr:glycerol-3-phosphate acyltransferase [Gammaproteobacteria bacterium]
MNNINELSDQLPFFLMSIAGLCAYLVGSISTAIITCKMMGLPDPRTQGSNNPGATNVMRFGGKKAAIITLLGDALKGLLPVIIATLLKMPAAVIAFVALAAFLGHLYPIFFRFQGGKGVATALGCILALSPFVALCALLVWIIIFKATKISSIAALTAALFCPIFLWVFNLLGLGGSTSIYIIISVIFMDIMLIIRHKDNIKRIYKGEEGSFSKNKKS